VGLNPANQMVKVLGTLQEYKSQIAAAVSHPALQTPLCFDSVVSAFGGN
jgi:hypothetical protein